MTADRKASKVIPFLLLGFGGAWFVTCLFQGLQEAAPPSREYLHQFWFLALGLVALICLAIRRLDKGSVIVFLAFLATCGPILLQWMRVDSLELIDFLAPLPAILAGGLTLLVQTSAQPADGVAINDPLRVPCNKFGCGITVSSLLIVTLSACVLFGNAMAMEGRSPGVETTGIIAAACGMFLAVAGCIVALIRKAPAR